VILLDVNILLYADNSDAPEHPRIYEWLGDLIAAVEPVGIPWLALWAFIRVATNPRLGSTPKLAASLG
jgi:predicted nucleic acid-binding protein